MQKEPPYQTLMKNPLAYEIMLLRDQRGVSFAEIAAKFQLSTAGARQIYNKMKIKQLRLYISRIAAAGEGETVASARKAAAAALECYQELPFAVAYLEKEYAAVLTPYRQGQPGMPEAFLRALPPFTPQLRRKTVSRIVELRETEKASFHAIAQRFHITPAKARRTYEMYYHEKLLALVRALQNKAHSEPEKAAIWQQAFHSRQSAKTRYNALLSQINEIPPTGTSAP